MTRYCLHRAILVFLLLVPVAFGTAQEDSSGEPESNLADMPKFTAMELEQLIHQEVNRRRERGHVKPLEYDTVLARIARGHSQDMAKNGYFSHIDSRGRNPTQRARAHGYPIMKNSGNLFTNGIAENIYRTSLHRWVVHYYGTTYRWKTIDQIAESVVNGWMESYGHRRNVLSRNADRQGIGIAVTGDFRVYVTQNLR